MYPVRLYPVHSLEQLTQLIVLDGREGRFVVEQVSDLMYPGKLNRVP